SRTFPAERGSMICAWHPRQPPWTPNVRLPISCPAQWTKAEEARLAMSHLARVPGLHMPAEGHYNQTVIVDCRSLADAGEKLIAWIRVEIPVGGESKLPAQISEESPRLRAVSLGDAGDPSGEHFA